MSEERNISPKDKSGKKINRLFRWLEIEKIISQERLVKNIPFFFLIVAFGMIHIANTNYAEKMAREKKVVEKELRKIKWKYSSKDAALKSKCKQSEIANKVKEVGLVELDVPPKIIAVETE